MTGKRQAGESQAAKKTERGANLRKRERAAANESDGPRTGPSVRKKSGADGSEARSDEQPMTVQQVADAHKKDRKTVEGWLKRGLPSHCDARGIIVIYPSDVYRHPRHSRPNTMGLVGLDQNSDDDRCVFTRVLTELNLLADRRFSDARVESIKNMLVKTTSSTATPTTAFETGSHDATPTRRKDAARGEQQAKPEPVDHIVAQPEAHQAPEHSNDDCEAALRQYHANKQMPQDLPDWFWGTHHARRFVPPTDVFKYEVLGIDTSSPRLYGMMHFHIVKVRRSAGYESSDEAPFFRQVGQRLLTLDKVPGSSGLEKATERLEQLSAPYQAARAAWREARSRHGSSHNGR